MSEKKPPRVVRLAGPKRTSAMGLAMLGLEEAIYGPDEAEVVVVSDDAGAPPDGNVVVTLGDDPSASTIRLTAKRKK